MGFYVGDEIAATDGSRYRIVERRKSSYVVQSKWGLVQEKDELDIDQYYYKVGLADLSEYPIYLPVANNSVDQQYCLHDWKKYVGIVKVYEYCTKCDAKRDVNE